MKKEKKQAKPLMQDFHFAGGMEYEPMTITAASQEEAQKEWEVSRNKANL